MTLPHVKILKIRERFQLTAPFAKGIPLEAVMYAAIVGASVAKQQAAVPCGGWPVVAHLFDLKEPEAREVCEELRISPDHTDVLRIVDPGEDAA